MKVTSVKPSGAPMLCDILFENGSSIVASSDHLFLVYREGWTKAEDLEGKEVDVRRTFELSPAA